MLISPCLAALSPPLCDARGFSILQPWSAGMSLASASGELGWTAPWGPLITAVESRMTAGVPWASQAVCNCEFAPICVRLMHLLGADFEPTNRRA